MPWNIRNTSRLEMFQARPHAVDEQMTFADLGSLGALAGPDVCLTRIRE